MIILVRAKLPEVDRRQGVGRRLQPGFKKCGKARCLCCVYSTNSRTHTSTLTGQTWPIKQNITCEDANVCYNITCSHGSGACQRKPAQYVGKVGPTRPCRQRCTEHRGAVTHHCLGHWGRRPLQPPGPRPRRLQLPPFRENTEHRPLRD